MRKGYTICLFAAFVILSVCRHSDAQAALLMEQPYGFFGAMNPTGHNAIYFQNICAETPLRLRRCEPGEMGSVIARYQGIADYDWVAIPLIPYLYSVESPAQVPQKVDREMVERMRNVYRERHLETLGPNLAAGNLIHGGWTQLVGVAYERRIYAFRFDTTPDEDDALIARLNTGPNRTNFNLLYSNCSDFARALLNTDFPHAFPRNIFPDALMTTPKQLAWRLERYARKHPETHLSIWEIPQIPGYRRLSRNNKGVAESLITTAYAIPIAVANPYIAGGLFADYLFLSRYRLVSKNVPVLSPDDLSGLTAPVAPPHTLGNTSVQALAPSVGTPAILPDSASVDSGQKEMKDSHE